MQPDEVFPIHAIWMQGCQRLAPRYRQNLRAWRRLHPGCRVQCWNETQLAALIDADLPFLRARWHRLELIQRADVGRFVLVYLFGGLYVDVDLQPHRSLMPVLRAARNDGALALIERRRRLPLTARLCNWMLFAGAPRHPFALRVLQEIGLQRRRIWEPRFLYVLGSTGSLFLSKLYERERRGGQPIGVRLIDEAAIGRRCRIVYDANWMRGKQLLDPQDALLLLLAMAIVSIVVCLWRCRST